MPELQGWAGRAERAHRNMPESLVLFAILVLAARALNVSNNLTVLAPSCSSGVASPTPSSTSPASAGCARRLEAVSVAGLLLIFLQLIT